MAIRYHFADVAVTPDAAPYAPIYLGTRLTHRSELAGLRAYLHDLAAHCGGHVVAGHVDGELGSFILGDDDDEIFWSEADLSLATLSPEDVPGRVEADLRAGRWDLPHAAVPMPPRGDVAAPPRPAPPEAAPAPDSRAVPLTTWRAVASALGISEDTLARHRREARDATSVPWFADAEQASAWWQALHAPRPVAAAPRRRGAPTTTGGPLDVRALVADLTRGR